MIPPIPAVHLPLLRPAAFVSSFPTAIGGDSPPWLVAMLRTDAGTPLQHDEKVRLDVRDALRTAGYKPTGRGKPASEYLLRAAADGSLGSINLAVDACNVVSLHSAFPISVVDLDRAETPFRIGIGGEHEQYVFNASGQEIRLTGLPCLYDAAGPCGNAVKDAQRTKTDPGTSRTLSVIWACHPHLDRAAHAVAWYRELVERGGGRTAEVIVAMDPPGAV
jgi:DNA/RNA-binding domain of Phe-tRNA-synthetase-like protein